MDDGMPPLVDRYTRQSSTSTVSSTWPPAPSTPAQWGNTASLPQGWGGVDSGAAWGHPQGTLTPMFSAPVTLGQPMAVWPSGGVMMGASPAVTAIPITALNTGNNNDDWVELERSEWDDRDEMSSTGFPITRSLSRHGSRSSHRSRTQFSDGSSPSSRSSELSRSRSFTGSVSIHDKRPPREWRSDFTMRSPTLGTVIGSMLNIDRPRSANRRRSITIPKVSLHPYLRHSSSSPSMFLDLRDNPAKVRFRDLGRPTNPWDLTRFACEPPLQVMTFYATNFPWYIEARSSNPSGVTLHDMFYAIWACMMMPITNEDYYNNEMHEESREKIADAWSLRCGDSKEERAMGVRRVDFLMEKVGLEGVTKGKDGMFELKVKRLL
ncbi:hypothetical protein BC835DRAFT_1420975 [Cytidiella melzeri]|nr:hypothetical protein BC835DRAFT_1420975 [Cytidiella melzeri]